MNNLLAEARREKSHARSRAMPASNSPQDKLENDADVFKLNRSATAIGFGSLFLHAANIIFSAVFLLLLLPFLISIFVLIKLETAGSALVTTKRFSAKSICFTAFSFRCHSLVGYIITATRIGKVLQRSGADQLPLLFNVLMGEISLGEAYQISRFVEQTQDSGYVASAHTSEFYPVSDANKTTDIVGGSGMFWAAKRLFDIAASIALLPVLLLTAAVLLVLNPFWNRGSLFFVQTRMG